MKTFLLSALVAAFVVGCATEAERSMRQTLGNPPEHLGRVQTMLYDKAAPALSPNPKIELYDNQAEIKRRFKAIALLTCEGAAREEVVMTEAIRYRAQMLGADALLLLDRESYAQSGGLVINGSGGGSGGTRRVFRAKAIVYESGK